MSVRHGQFMERNGVLPTTQFSYRNGLGTCDALLCVSHTLQSALESGQEARIVQIDFRAAFDRVNHPRDLQSPWMPSRPSESLDVATSAVVCHPARLY